MAALVAGVQYGLSSHSNFPENKSLIFVKLTDSAQRAIEDFLRNRNKTNQNPTIQFLGNEGQLSFPSTQSSHGSAGFTFSLSGNQDIEGPQGGFECIQQTSPKSMESLGTLPWKMRIQANDDVYETTRHRMAVAEENNKNKCTRVIKANGPDIGRKVKVKATGKTIPPITNVRQRESTIIPTSSSQSSRPPSNVPTSVSSTTSLSSSSSSYKPMQSNNPPLVRMQEKKVSDIMRRPLRERLIHLLALRPYKRPELYDRINKEGIKERDRSTTTTLLKQVAFMRDNTYHLHRHVWNDVQEDWPFYSEQEKAMLKRRKPQNLTPPGSSDGGSSGSGQSPNSTHPGSPPAITAPPPGLMSLKRPGYYQSADGLQTKRPRISHFRKSDSGSSTTGNSYNGGNSNRENTRTTGGCGSIGSNNSLVGGTNSSFVSASSAVNGIVVASEINNWDQRQSQQQHQQQHQQQQQQQQQQNNQQRERVDYRAERTTNSDVIRVGFGGNYGNAKSCLTPTSDCEENNHSSALIVSGTNSIGNHTGSNHHSHYNLSHNNNSTSNHHHINGSKVATGGESNFTGGGNGGGSGISNSSSSNNSNNITGNNSGGIDFVRSLTGEGANNFTGMSNGISSERRDRDERSSSRGIERERERERDREREREREREARDNNLSASGTNSYNDFTNLGASKYTGNSATTTKLTVNNPTISTYSPASPEISSTSKNLDYPDYLTYYTTISSTEQRRRYKDEFNADYEEYRRLHTLVAKVSKRFAQLEERRRREIENGNRDKSEEIKLQILQEYDETKNNPVHIETKKRFAYLHEKLSHIKRLVLEYDTQNFAGNGGTGNGGVGNGGVVDVENSGGLRY